MLAIAQGGFLGIIPLILVIAAVILFVIAAVNRPQTQPYLSQLIAWGLACWALATVITMAGGM